MPSITFFIYLLLLFLLFLTQKSIVACFSLLDLSMHLQDHTFFLVVNLSAVFQLHLEFLLVPQPFLEHVHDYLVETLLLQVLMKLEALEVIRYTIFFIQEDPFLLDGSFLMLIFSYLWLQNMKLNQLLCLCFSLCTQLVK